MPIATTEERLGTVVGGKYRLDAILGEGGMGVVYSGYDEGLERAVAVKFLHAQYARDPQTVKRFFAEARAVARMRHPNVVEVYDLGRADDGAAYIVLELLEGESLAARLLRGPLSLDETIACLSPVLDALHRAHDQGIIHRDLKPDNIFLSDGSRGRTVPKVLDFGVAKLIDASRSTMTAQGTVVGTPAYMAPEQAMGDAQVGPAVDVWAMGVVAFECLTGRLPFDIRSDMPAAAILVAVVSTQPARLAEILPGIPAAVAACVDRALTKDLSVRWDSVRAFQDALHESEPAHVVTTFDGQTPTASGSQLAKTLPMMAAANAAASPPAPSPVGAVTMGSPSRPTGRLGLYAAVIVVTSLVGFGLALGLIGWTRGADGALPATVSRAPSLLPGEGSAAPSPEPARIAESVAAGANAAGPVRIAPGWVLIEPPADDVLLGLDGEIETEDVSGFRPTRAVMAPSEAYEIQQREITWRELDPWLESSGIEMGRPNFVPASPRARASMPVAGVPWAIARGYCLAVGGRLPTEAEWEYAARGERRRPHPWGSAAIDRGLVRVYMGDSGSPAPGGQSEQDRTPGPAPVFDLAGNVQEWTIDLWTPNRAGGGAGEESDISLRAVRGLPLFGVLPHASLPASSASYRMPACVRGACSAGPNADGIGFRCVRAPGTVQREPPTPMPELRGTVPRARVARAPQEGRTARAAGALLTADEIRDVVRRGQGDLQRCWDSEIRGMRDVPTTRVEVRLTIGRSGTVTSAQSTGGFGNLGMCIERNVRRWRFPESGDDSRTMFPVVFQTSPETGG